MQCQRDKFLNGMYTPSQIWDSIPLQAMRVKLRPKRVCCGRPRGNIQGEAKNVAGVRILGIGEVDSLSYLGVGSLTELPLKPLTLNLKTQSKTLALNPVWATRVLWVKSDMVRGYG